MATETKRIKQALAVTAEPAAQTPRSLPNALDLLRGLNDVARALEPFHEGNSSLRHVAEGVENLLGPEGVAILTRVRPGEYVFRHVTGVLHECNGFALSGPCCALLDEVLRRDEVILFHRRQKNP